MKTALRILAVIAIVLVLFVAGTYAWASAASSRVLTRTHQAHAVDFPVPLPDSASSDSAAADAADGGLARARERGRHLIEARYICSECHGADFGGGVMVDNPLIGRLLGPNITRGQGSRVLAYTPADWDRIVRHGVKPDGKPAVMPSIDFVRMSDQELSDIVAFIQSQPPVDREVPPVRTGPLGKLLVATGQIRLTADELESHDAPHAKYPPKTEVTLEFGAHVAATCAGCHRPDFSGGPVPGGDPSWAPATNLTQHAEGLQGWSLEDFRLALTEGKRPDGSELKPPMDAIVPSARRMTDVEVEALWRYLESLPPVPDGK